MTKEEIEAAAKAHVKTVEGDSPEAVEESSQSKPSIGTIDVSTRPLIADNIGHKNIPLENLPSQGIFYPEGTQITIRAAVYKEIRHWSTIDENDMLNLNDMLNYVIERCAQIKIPGQNATYKDIKEIDRFYIVFAISEYTSIEGKQKAQATVETPDGESKVINLTKEMLKIFEIPDSLEKYIDRETSSLKFTIDTGEVVYMTLPSIGMIEKLQGIRNIYQQKGKSVDDDFIMYAPFVLHDHKSLSEKTYRDEEVNSLKWSLEKLSLVPKITEILVEGVSANIEFIDDSGAEVTAPLNFLGGAKSLFLISDILDRLV